MIIASSGVFYYSTDYSASQRAYEMAKRLYPDFKVSLIDLNSEERIDAVDVDPDFGDIKTGFVVLVVA
ncbi:MAG: hypothetical protein QXL80_03640 [Metallosphaera sp.]